jgi:AcrR family transcriptional regulator
MPKIVDHQERRDQIALVACRVVAEYGFEQATIVRIAREAGYTTGMVAHYFDTKQDIIIAALRLILQRIEARLTRPATGPRPQLLAVLTEALPIDPQRYTEVRILDRVLGPGVGRQASAAHQCLGASRIHAAVRALRRRRLAGMGALGIGHARAGAALGGHLHQRTHRQRGGEPERLACGQTDRAAAAAIATAARLGQAGGEVVWISP